MRKVITLTSNVSDSVGESVWRQSAYNLRHTKRMMRKAQNAKRSKSKNEKQKQKNDRLIKKAHQEYMDVSNFYLQKSKETIEKARNERSDDIMIAKIKEIEGFIEHAERQIDQINRRIILGEVIPHNEKVFSIFEPHTEWVCKGKAGVPVELGVKVCIMEDQHQFILYHQVMRKQTDDEVAVLMVQETQKRFPNFIQTSFDKGFHSPENQNNLNDILNSLILPRKGKLSKSSKEIENAPNFRKGKRQHSAVESAINALEVHGLDICPDHGIIGFKRYVSLAVLARNIQQIGAILKKKEEASALRKRKRKMRANLIAA